MNELHEKINQAKKYLGLSNNGLAAALGYSKPYITKVLNKLPGDKVQKRLIGEIIWLLGENRVSGGGASVKSIDTGEIIKQKDAQIKQLISSEFGARCLLDIRKREISELNHKLIKERILSVIIFAVILALFLASHAI